MQVQEELRKRTEQDWPRAAHMMVPVEEGQFLAWIVGTLRCRRAIELGTFTGYSALLLAEVWTTGPAGQQSLPTKHPPGLVSLLGAAVITMER